MAQWGKLPPTSRASHMGAEAIPGRLLDFVSGLGRAAEDGASPWDPAPIPGSGLAQLRPAADHFWGSECADGSPFSLLRVNSKEINTFLAKLM